MFFALILALFGVNTTTLKSQALNDSSSMRDSLVSTFPFLIVDSAERALLNVEMALEINKKHNSDKVSAYGNYCLGYYYRIKGNNRTAIRFQKKAYDYYIEMDNPNRKVLVLNELGILYKNISQYELAIQTYITGIEIAEEHDLDRLADVYTNLAVVYTLIKNNDLGLVYLFKGLELEEDAVGKTTIYINIGAVYVEEKQDSLAMIYLNKALKVCDDNDLPQYNRNDVLQNIANVLIDRGDYKTALAYLFEIKAFEEGENSLRDLVFTNLSIALAYKKMDNLNNAEKYANVSIALAKETETNAQLLLGYELLSGVHEKQKKYRKAYEVYQLYVELKDSVFNIDKTKHIEDLVAGFEAERKESEILLLKKERELQEKELIARKHVVNNHKIIRNITIGVALILLIGAFLMVFFYQQKIRDGQLLALKTEEVNKQKIYGLLRDQEFYAIQAGINGREKERKRIAQELHDGIGGNLASIKLNLANIISNDSTEKLQLIMRNIDDTCKEVRAISHNLFSFKIMNHSFTSLVKKFLNEITAGETIEVKFNFFPEDKLNQLPNEIKVELYRVIQELMSNVIKYSKATNVDVQLIEREGYVNLMLEDDGLGFDTKTAKSGIGLRNIRSRIKALNGEFSIESSIGNWTLVNIEIPTDKV